MWKLSRARSATSSSIEWHRQFSRRAGSWPHTLYCSFIPSASRTNGSRTSRHSLSSLVRMRGRARWPLCPITTVRYSALAGCVATRSFLRDDVVSGQGAAVGSNGPQFDVSTAVRAVRDYNAGVYRGRRNVDVDRMGYERFRGGLPNDQ